MRNLSPSPSPNRFLRHALVGLAFLGAVAMLSLPAARGAGPVGWVPMWLLGMPLAALAALVLADLRARRPAADKAPILAAVSRRRPRPAQVRRRPAGRPVPARRRPGSPAVA